MKRSAISYLVLAVLLVVTVWIALTNGASHFSLLKMTATDANTLFNIRLPRIITALMAGAMLSVSGAFFQAALRNPIADPGIMGVSAGAALFAFVGALLLPSFFFGKVVFAFVGGALALGVLIFFQPQMDPYRLILIGVALNATFTGIASVFSSTSQVSLGTVTWLGCLTVTVLGILGLIGVVLVTNWGNYLKVSDEQLRSLGLSAGKLRLALLGLAVFLATTSTAVIGVIAFIGIIVPHVGRVLVGRGALELAGMAVPAGRGAGACRRGAEFLGVLQRTAGALQARKKSPGGLQLPPVMEVRFYEIAAGIQKGAAAHRLRRVFVHRRDVGGVCSAASGGLGGL